MIDLNLNGVAVSVRGPRNLLASLRPRALVFPPYQDQQRECSLLDLSECSAFGIVGQAGFETEFSSLTTLDCDCGSARVRTKTPPVANPRRPTRSRWTVGNPAR